MIMARRMTLEGAKVKAVVELMPYLAGLTRNRVQCIDDFGIPLYLGHTITEIRGEERITGVTVCKVDGARQPIPETAFDIDCDTLLCSVGLVPENELSRKAGIELDPVTRGPVVDSTLMTSCPGVFACGNVLHVNDLVDNVSEESERAGAFAAAYAVGAGLGDRARTAAAKAADAGTKLVPGEGVRYLVPASIAPAAGQKEIKAYFRVTEPLQDVTVQVLSGGTVLSEERKIRVNPGEMESVTIDTEQANGAEDVSVRVVPAGKEARDGN